MFDPPKTDTMDHSTRHQSLPAAESAGSRLAASAIDRALIIDADPVRGREMARVLQSVFGEVHRATHASQAPVEGWGIVVIGQDELTEENGVAAIARFEPYRASGRLLVSVGSSSDSDLATMFGLGALTNVHGWNPGFSSDDDLLVTVQKIRRSDLFGLEKYFPWSAVRKEMLLYRASERHAVIDGAGSFATKHGVQPSLADAFRLATDELVTNAIFNAPVDVDGRSLYGHLPRREEVVLPPNKPIEVVFCTHGRRVGISVKDPFGSLRLATVTSYIAKCLRAQEDQVDSKAGGAGLGLFYVFQSVSQFVINLSPGTATEMIGILDTSGRYKSFRQRRKSFNVFAAGGG
jgi:anti-sigma regulatory factor (Ser/Thr protein kinase)